MVILECGRYRLLASGAGRIFSRYTIQRKGRFFWRNVASSEDLEAACWATSRLAWPWRSASCGC